MKRAIQISFLLAVIFLCTPANANLIDYGSGMIYDTDLNITWLQDANLAASNTFGVSGIDPGGTMNWNTAQDWIAAMNTANYLGYSGWRLPTTPGTSFDYTTEGEMAHLYYIELNNPQGDGVSSGGLTNRGPFINWARWYYWTGTEYAPDPGPVFDFRFNDGYQGASYRELHRLYAWAVHDGNIASTTPVPEPASILLFGSGLVFYGVLKRMKGKKN